MAKLSLRSAEKNICGVGICICKATAYMAVATARAFKGVVDAVLAPARLLFLPVTAAYQTWKGQQEEREFQKEIQFQKKIQLQADKASQQPLQMLKYDNADGLVELQMLKYDNADGLVELQMLKYDNADGLVELQVLKYDNADGLAEQQVAEQTDGDPAALGVNELEAVKSANQQLKEEVIQLKSDLTNQCKLRNAATKEQTKLHNMIGAQQKQIGVLKEELSYFRAQQQLQTGEASAGGDAGMPSDAATGCPSGLREPAVA